MNELSPAERYKRSKENSKFTKLEAFASELRFPLDDFQEKSCRALESGSGVLVAAPTGAGKTIVGEFAIYLAVQSGQKVFYTTPIKALSNQKFAELTAKYGKEKVGLLTGDTNNNSDAQIVVMTTEVLRNMIYANSQSLRDLGFVVMDEVHYLADRFRGAVWEEVILHLPKDVRVVSLSATVSNAEEFGAWLAEVRGNTQIIVSEIRPVPLHQHVMLGDEILELFESGSNGMRVNPELARKHQALQRNPIRTRGKGGHHQRDRGSFQKLDKPRVVSNLEEAGLLPAIFFIFSRAGCEGAVSACRRDGLRLTNREEQLEIRRIAEARCSSIADEDLDTLGYFDWLASLERGFAAHHAGMLPAFKEVVEELFLRKLVRVVFATETLALGINMPARTVVLERLDKFNGEGRVQITAGEYTQLTGRAGRRGIDTEGHSVILWGQQLDPNLVAGLASKRTYPLNSSFKPTYNMAVNLISAFGAHRASKMLEKSFAQFQADRGVVGLARVIAEKQESLEGYESAMECHLGDFIEYSRIRREISDLERGNYQNRNRAGKDLRQSKGARQLEMQLADLKRQMRAHPSHGCADREAHARWGERYQKLRKEIDAAVSQIESRTNLVARTFNRICQLLTDLNYLVEEDDDLEVTDSGNRLAKIYGERDLLIAECINKGAWTNLDPANLAALGMALVYEGRRDEGDYEPKLPKGDFRDALEATENIQEQLLELQTRYRLPKETQLDLGLCWATYRWASGARLDDVLKLSGLLPGDFIRWSKQLIDLLDQLSKGADAKLAETAYRAMDLVKRGIVAYSYYI
ncbi:MAG: DEAD/DEAH box helicase [Aquiluna sp.]|nr:DEAD/DEAH box helicase [Aquiluna sp.]MCF8544996.1 DEAD/DEAH box helicase [Aquiluna sp.]